MAGMSIALALHALAAVIWVGGMAFVHWFVRPAAGALDGPVRQRLLRDILARFFPVVWTAIAVLLLSGYHMIFAGFGTFAAAGTHVHIMQVLGIAMMLIFAHLYFAPWRRFRAAVENGDGEAGARHLGLIRRLVTVNLTLGLILVAIASSGRYWG